MNKLPEEDLEHILEYTKDIWDQFKDKSIFLTGGTGFFGKWILESFLYVNEKRCLNAKITVLTRDPDNFLANNPFYNEYSKILFFAKGDILNSDFFIEENFEYIIHAATNSDEKENLSNPINLADSIISGTKNILEFARKNPLISFLNISSGGIYGRQPIEVQKIKETDTFFIDLYNPKASYFEGKRAAEMYASLYYQQYKVPIKTARCFAFVGPYLPLNKHFAIGNFISDVLNNQDINIKSDGEALRSYMYMSDLIIWLWRILAIGQNNNAYNIGSENTIKLKDLANKIIRNYDSKVIIQNLSKNKYADIYIPNTEKAMNLGMNIHIELDDAIQKTINFYKNGNR